MNKMMIISITLVAVLAVSLIPMILHESDAKRSVDVLIYGYRANMDDVINATHVSLLESKGYAVVARNGPVNATDLNSARVVIDGGIDLNSNNATELLKEYVMGGGRLLLSPNTQYSYCNPMDLTDRSCAYDFTRNAFGFKFDGSVQYSTIYPAHNQSLHPIWNTPNQISNFTDWCCDAYVAEIIDKENIAVLSTVSGQAHKPSGYYRVHDVPAIIVNNNPDFNGGMVIGAGRHMIIGWNEPDLRMFENVIAFMLSGTDHTAPTIAVPEDIIFEATGPLTVISQDIIGTANATDAWGNSLPVVRYGITIPNTPSDTPSLLYNSSSFSLGSSALVWTAQDSSGYVSVETQLVTVQDTIPPAILTLTDMIFTATGNLTSLTVNDYGTAFAIDLVDPSPIITSNAPNLFPLGDTVITWTAIDSSENKARTTQTITVTPPIFETITDGFEDDALWEIYSAVYDYVPISGPDYTTFSNYTFTIEQQGGNPLPSARISGDGFVSYFAIQRNVTLSDLGENDLFVGIDYKATSATSASSVTNAKIELLDGDGSILYSNWLSRGGTVNTGWSTFSQNVTDAVAGSGIITIRLGLNDGWIANWSQNAYFDNLYVGTTPSTADQVSSPQEEMSPIQILSERIAQADDTELCRIASEGLPYSDDLISYYNRTATC